FLVGFPPDRTGRLLRPALDHRPVRDPPRAVPGQPRVPLPAVQEVAAMLSDQPLRVPEVGQAVADDRAGRAGWGAHRLRASISAFTASRSKTRLDPTPTARK